VNDVRQVLLPRNNTSHEQQQHQQQQQQQAAAAAAEQRQLRLLFSSYPWLTAFGSSCGWRSIGYPNSIYIIPGGSLQRDLCFARQCVFEFFVPGQLAIYVAN